MRLGVGGGGRILRGGASVGRGGVRGGVGVGPFSVRGGAGGRRRGGGSDTDVWLWLLTPLLVILVSIIVAYFAAGAVALVACGTYFIKVWRRRPTIERAVVAGVITLASVGSFLTLASVWRSHDYEPFSSCGQDCDAAARDARSSAAYRWQLATTAAAAIVVLPTVSVVVLLERRAHRRLRAARSTATSSRGPATTRTSSTRAALTPSGEVPARVQANRVDVSAVNLLVTYSPDELPPNEWWTAFGVEIARGLEDGTGHIGRRATGIGDAFRLFRCSSRDAYDAAHWAADFDAILVRTVTTQEADDLARAWPLAGGLRSDVSGAAVHLLVAHAPECPIADELWQAAGRELKRGMADPGGRVDGRYVGAGSLWRLMECTPAVAFDSAHRIAAIGTALVCPVPAAVARRIQELPQIRAARPAPVVDRAEGTSRATEPELSLEEQLALAVEPVQRHFLYNRIEERLYRLRDQEPDALMRYDETCVAHDAEIETIVRALALRSASALPLLPLYEQQCIRQRKAGNLAAGLRWAERGITVYRMVDAASPHATDLERRAAWFTSRLERP